MCSVQTSQRHDTFLKSCGLRVKFSKKHGGGTFASRRRATTLPFLSAISGPLMHSSRPKVQFIYHEDSEPLENQLPETTTYARWRLGIALLIVLSTPPYVPCLTHDFGIADEINLTQNPLLRGRGAALGVMWRPPSIMPHFGPLAYTFFM